MALEWEWHSATGLPGFLSATVEQAHRVLGTQGVDQTYEAGTHFHGLAMKGMSVSSADEDMAMVSGALHLIWGELTDAMDAPGTGSPEQDAAAAQNMKRAAAEWLNAVNSPKERAAYLDRWAHDECGYARKPL